MATVNMYRKFVIFGHVVFQICEWIERHADILTAILCTSMGVN